MSSTTRAKRPGELDRYYTPDDVALACVAALHLAPGLTIVEPSVGGGAFAMAARVCSEGCRIVGIDADPNASGLVLVDEDHVGDFLHWQPAGPVQYVIGNPPFNEAEAHVRHALAVSQYGVAMLLRLAFLETAKRAEFWREHPPDEVHVLVRRPSFTGGATDSAAYGWFVWRKLECDRPPTLHWLDWSAGGGNAP